MVQSLGKTTFCFVNWYNLSDEEASKSVNEQNTLHVTDLYEFEWPVMKLHIISELMNADHRTMVKALKFPSLTKNRSDVHIGSLLAWYSIMAIPIHIGKFAR